MLKTNKPLVLASSSASRKMLLKRLQMDFSCISPNIDESPRKGESNQETCQRLAIEKAQAVTAAAPDHLIISSDQIAVCENTVLHKPLSKDKAIEQLQFQSGKQTQFYTSLCLFNSKKNDYQLGMETYTASFRQLSIEEIERYIDLDDPLHCAGSFKSESAGICLFTQLKGNDPTALVGLPLIMLTRFLRNAV